MSTPTIKELCERATLDNPKVSLEGCAEAIKKLQNRLSPAVVLKVVEALEYYSRLDCINDTYSPANEALSLLSGPPTMEEARTIYQAGYLTQRCGGFRTPCPLPLGSWEARAWNQGYDHAAYAERHRLTHLNLPKTQSDTAKQSHEPPIQTKETNSAQAPGEGQGEAAASNCKKGVLSGAR